MMWLAGTGTLLFCLALFFGSRYIMARRAAALFQPVGCILAAEVAWVALGGRPKSRPRVFWVQANGDGTRPDGVFRSYWMTWVYGYTPNATACYVGIGDHQPYSATALSHELNHAYALQMGGVDDHDSPVFKLAVERAVTALRARGM